MLNLNRKTKIHSKGFNLDSRSLRRKNYITKFAFKNSREFDQSKEEIEESCPNQIFSESVINLNGSFLSKIKNKAQNVKTIIEQNVKSGT
ncbi:hypothetical protein BpHYR1_002295 [Brachionus plicatilis]|uniref:Uncharacterized protein n=1 Tax=Brachionus plicatilis TaxID=10195 RepID=A0A3M7P518_BRAPC|nr:hypothetical protein BpHYR1_002295 [Brachionus plicatilis]